MAVAMQVEQQGSPAVTAEDSFFTELYETCRSDLVALCRRRLGPNGDAEAIAQEAFLRAWTALDRYSDARPFWPWLATIARRLCVDHLRRRGREREHAYRQRPDFSAWPQPEEEVERVEEHRIVRAALQQLKPHEQRLLRRREIEGWSIDQLALSEGTSNDAVRSALKRSRATLRQSYAHLIAAS